MDDEEVESSGYGVLIGVLLLVGSVVVDEEDESVGDLLLWKQGDDTLHAEPVGGGLRIGGLLQLLHELHVAWHGAVLLQLLLHGAARLNHCLIKVNIVE